MNESIVMFAAVKCAGCVVDCVDKLNLTLIHIQETCIHIKSTQH